MKTIKSIIYAAVVSLAFIGSSEASTCPSESFDLRINSNFPAEVILHNRSRKELGAYLNEKALLGYVTQGLTVVQYQSGFSAEYASRQLRDGSWCSRVKQLTIDFGLSDKPYIYIAREVARGTCLYNEVMKHEYQHLNISKEMVNVGSRQLKIGLRNSLAVNGVRANTSSEAIRILEQNITSSVDSITSQLYQIAETKNAMLDTPANYALLGRICR